MLIVQNWPWGSRITEFKKSNSLHSNALILPESFFSIGVAFVLITKSLHLQGVYVQIAEIGDCG